MPFGLTNVPATFQAFIQGTLQILLIFSVLFILMTLFSKIQSEHEMHVRNVLERPRANSLYANTEKWQFDHPEVEYLDF